MSDKFVINYNSILSTKNSSFSEYSNNLKSGYDKINALQDKFNYDNYLNYAWKQVVTKFDEIILKRDSIDDWWTNYLENVKTLENQLPDNLNFNIVKVDATKYYVDHSSIIVNIPTLNEYISSHRTGEIIEQVEDSSSSSAPVTYTIQKGDNLSKIARKYGLTWQELYNANRDVVGSNPNLIYPGQVLTIPGVSGGSVVSSGNSYSGSYNNRGSSSSSSNNNNNNNNNDSHPDFLNYQYDYSLGVYVNNDTGQPATMQDIQSYMSSGGFYNNNNNNNNSQPLYTNYHIDPEQGLFINNDTGQPATFQELSDMINEGKKNDSTNYGININSNPNNYVNNSNNTWKDIKSQTNKRIQDIQKNLPVNSATKNNKQTITYIPGSITNAINNNKNKK